MSTVPEQVRAKFQAYVQRCRDRNDNGGQSLKFRGVPLADLNPLRCELMALLAEQLRRRTEGINDD